MLLGALAACGPTAVERARDAEYRVRRDRLWAQIVDVLRERYPNARIESMDAERLVTDWFSFNKVRVEGRKSTYRPAYLQVSVNVRGANPYHVDVAVRGAVDDVDGSRRIASGGDWHRWVEPTERKLTLAIHDRLAGTRDAR